MEPERILTRELFLFLLDLEIKRARRYQNFISFIVVKLLPNSNGRKAMESCYKILTNLLVREMRETDILGALSEDRLVTLLPYADVLAGGLAKSRLEINMKPYDLGRSGCDVKIQHLCFPGDGAGTAEIIGKVLGESM